MLALLVVGMVGLLLQCVALDLAVMDDPDSDEHVLYDFDTSVRFFFPQLALTVVGWVVLANYYAVSWHHYLTFQLLPRNPDRFRHATRRNPPPFYRSHLRGSFLFEVLVLAVQPIPWACNTWAYEALSLLMFFRIYLIGRAVRDWALVQAQQEALFKAQERVGTEVHVSVRLASKVLYSQVAD